MYRENSGWNDITELECFLIAKLLKDQNFKRGLQSQLCKNLANRTELKVSSITAKVGNYKTLMGIIGDSNYSLASKKIYDKYKIFTAKQIFEILDKSNNNN